MDFSNYLSFEGAYKRKILDREIRRTLRYGNRTIQFNEKLPFNQDEVVIVKFKLPPYDKLSLEYDEETIQAKIEGVSVRTFGDIRLEDLVGSDFQDLNMEAVKERLYNKKIRDGELVTLVEFRRI